MDCGRSGGDWRASQRRAAIAAIGRDVIPWPAKQQRRSNKEHGRQDESSDIRRSKHRRRGIGTGLVSFAFGPVMMASHRRRRIQVRAGDDGDRALFEARHEPGGAEQPHRDKKRQGCPKHRADQD